MTDAPPFTRRTYLVLKAMENTGCDFFAAVEAVSTTAIEHPEWDMQEAHSWIEWEKLDASPK
jgi:hypothetical protein